MYLVYDSHNKINKGGMEGSGMEAEGKQSSDGEG